MLPAVIALFGVVSEMVLGESQSVGLQLTNACVEFAVVLDSSRGSVTVLVLFEHLSTGSLAHGLAFSPEVRSPFLW